MPPPTAGDNLNIQVMQQLLLFLQQQTTQHQNTLNPGSELDTQDRVLERFLRFNPPVFIGEPDDVKAEYWLEKIDSIFSALNYTEEQQLTLVVFCLEAAHVTGGARWRINGSKMVLEEHGRILCRNFEINIFYKWLSKYAPGSVSTEDERMYKFTRGLRNELQKKLLPVELDSYVAVVRATARIESGLSRLGPYPNGVVGSSKKPIMGRTPRALQKFQKNRVNGKHKSSKLCSYCHKPGHTPENCWRKQGKCLKCGSDQH
ncbi:hypothetical protein DH2020_027276 [Rehmannia glutinosa]|uniref:Uncharacterized protein n=1 Tax=Rehmannia glutinosa TaxID=99300 RepID=A0ABR0VXE6_REHGL